VSFSSIEAILGCALRRAELAALTMEDIQQREGRWVIADLRGKGAVAVNDNLGL